MVISPFDITIFIHPCTYILYATYGHTHPYIYTRPICIYTHIDTLAPRRIYFIAPRYVNLRKEELSHFFFSYHSFENCYREKELCYTYSLVMTNSWQCPTAGASAYECSQCNPIRPLAKYTRLKLLSNQRLFPSPCIKYWERSINVSTETVSKVTC